MTSKSSRPDALTGIGSALRSGLAVPVDTMITEDIPLLLTRLSGVPYAVAARVVPAGEDTEVPRDG